MSQNSKPTIKTISTDLSIDRIWLAGGAAISILSAFLLVFMIFQRGRVDLVYLTEDKFDAPTLLEKVSSSKDAIKADRYLKGMVRRFISNYFITPDMTDDEAKSALQWAIMHTSSKGVKRSKAFLRDFKEFNERRQQSYAAFKPLLDDNSVTIKQSNSSSSRYLITVAGTYVSKNSDGENYSSAVLRMIIEAGGVNGVPDRDAGDVVNATGLYVQSAAVSLQNGSDVATLIELF